MTAPFRTPAPFAAPIPGRTLFALGIALMLSACGGMADNRSLDNVHQPVVEHTNYTFDVPTFPDGGLDPVQGDRLAAWLGTLGLKYGDHLTIDDPAGLPANHAAVGAIAARMGLLIEDVAPVTEGTIAPRTIRVVISRASAHVDGCPDWADKADANYRNATSKNYGCAISSNLAAMIANPEDLIHGQTGQGQTVVMSNAKAIEAFRAKPPTGAQALKQTSSTSN